MLTLALFLVYQQRAHALDKQGSAHGGSVEGAESGVRIAGSLMLGASLYNPTYAARPDNTGLALMRYAGHLDVDLIGSRLSIPIDINTFTDREADGAKKLAPSELDLIGGVTSTWGVGVGAIEGGARVEHDRGVAPSGASQTYADVRVRYLYSIRQVAPGLSEALRGGDVSGYLTLGWFAYNPSYFARPDNTGRALFRYAAHVETSFYREIFSAGLDFTFFTDRENDNVFKPSELDFTPEVVAHLGDFEIHLAYERDLPIDRGGLKQHFVYALGVWSFSLFDSTEKQSADQSRVSSLVSGGSSWCSPVARAAAASAP